MPRQNKQDTTDKKRGRAQRSHAAQRRSLPIEPSAKNDERKQAARNSNYKKQEINANNITDLENKNIDSSVNLPKVKDEEFFAKPKFKKTKPNIYKPHKKSKTKSSYSAEHYRSRTKQERISPPPRAISVNDSKENSDSRHKKSFVDATMRKNFMKLGIMVFIGVGIILGIYYGVQSIIEKQSGFKDIEKTVIPSVISTQTPRDRNAFQITSEGVPETPNPAVIRDISYGARDIEFKEEKINIPGIYDNELLFSAGSGGLSYDSDVLTKLYLYNLDAGDETLIAESTLASEKGEIFETLVNHKWLIWLDSNKHKKNYLMVMNRSTGKITKIKSFTNGKPKLRLYDDILVWMEQVSSTEDRLCMFDLNYQEPLILFTFTDKATYGVSAPCVYENMIVWSGPDPTQSDEEKLINEHSAIYYQRLEADESGTLSEPKYYSPKTYVHEPLYNGDVFVWLDANKSPNSNLYYGRPNEEAKLIANGVTTYSVGDGIIVYGKDQAVWVYIIATGELCRLTSPGEMGMLPSVTKRTVAWYNLSAQSDKDVLRFKVLTDEDLYPGGT